MSRIGKAPVTIPAGVQVNYSDNVVVVKGKNGELHQVIDDFVQLVIEDNVITFNLRAPLS